MTSYKRRIEENYLMGFENESQKIYQSLLGTGLRCAVFSSFICPKTNSDAVKLVYGVKDTREISMASFVEHRTNLERNGFIEKTDFKNRGGEYKASMEPAVAYSLWLNESNSSQADKYTDDFYRAYSIIIDSDWFRQFFSNNFLRQPLNQIMGYRNITWELNTRSSGKSNPQYRLSIYKPLDMIGLIATEIGLMVSLIGEIYSAHRFQAPVSLNELCRVGNFDEIIANRSEYGIDADVLESIEEFMKDVRTWGEGRYGSFYPASFMDHLAIIPAFIPHEIDFLMMRAGSHDPLSYYIHYGKPAVEKILWG